MDSKQVLANLPLRRRCFFLTDRDFLRDMLHQQQDAFAHTVSQMLSAQPSPRSPAEAEAEAATDTDTFLHHTRAHLSHRLAQCASRESNTTHTGTDSEMASARLIADWCDHVEDLLCGLEDATAPEGAKTAARRLLGAYVKAFYQAGKAFYGSTTSRNAKHSVRQVPRVTAKRERSPAREADSEDGCQDCGGDPAQHVARLPSSPRVRVTWSVGGPIPSGIYQLINPIL